MMRILKDGIRWLNMDYEIDKFITFYNEYEIKIEHQKRIAGRSLKH
jgi:hypothetical protein